MFVKEVSDADLSNGFLIVGFPGLGFVGGLGGHFLVEHLKMRHVASVYDNRFPPTVVIRAGKALSPIRLYTTEEACGLDGKCERLVVLVGDALPPPETLTEVAHDILEWARDKGVTQVAILEGYNAGKSPSGNGAAVVRAASSLPSKALPKSLKLEAVQEGIISSPGAAFLLAANRLDLPCLTLLAAVKGEAPDPLAASNLLARVDPMLPRIDLGSKEFQKRVKTIAGNLKQATKEQADGMRAMRRTSDIMYH